MRHRKAGRKFSRSSAHRRAMFRNILTSLVMEERITTTDSKAKEVKRLADKLITIAKKGDLHSRRRAISKLGSKDAVAKLFDNLGPRFKGRAGGYTRILKVGTRLGDAAPMSILEWTDQAMKLAADTDDSSDEGSE
jgi:large subunit ribosomal protein L17